MAQTVNRVGIPLVGHRASRSGASPARVRAQYLRDSQSGVIKTRMAPLRESRDDIRRAWEKAAGLAVDLIQNSGRLKGAVDQVIADTVGSGLLLNPTPDLSNLGYDTEETRAFVKMVKTRWKAYARNAAECDLRGKLTVAQKADVGLRWYIAFGEVLATNHYMGPAERAKYGIKTGTKSCLIPPSRLVQDTNDSESLFQGVYHDANGRPEAYLFSERSSGILIKKKLAARDLKGRRQVLHLFEPNSADDVRGISVLAAAFRKHIQHEMLDDATLQTAILQTIFAATITSDKPTLDAFEALEAMKSLNPEGGQQFADGYGAYLEASLERAANSTINIGADPQISHLAPGEELNITSAGTPGGQYLPFSKSLSRDMARAIGMSYGGLTMDHTDATYSSVRMENASIWPVVVRRRSNIAAPVYQNDYEQWLDEQIGTGQIPLKGGYPAFLANRSNICSANWQGPAKPSADDLKSAKGSTERIQNGTSSIAVESADLGVDSDEIFEQRHEEHQRYLDAGMQSPYSPKTKPVSGVVAKGDPEDEKQQGLELDT